MHYTALHIAARRNEAPAELNADGSAAARHEPSCRDHLPQMRRSVPSPQPLVRQPEREQLLIDCMVQGRHQLLLGS